MLIMLLVVILSPAEDFLDGLREWEIAMRDEGLRVARNVQPVQLLQRLLHLLLVHIEVDWDDTRSCTFQKFDD